ncbi:hypothetical protein B0J12DRAFT_196150 [Macrophomina phaseolina]|uniref:Secreted protein n=1 Tax=Macrophomina phaseolina TaxID=35725 RepID=A0ABQ8G5R4_9PEZI|nr:hypothetical protein B0J12DRAFT_196150 [Macrophomina phaseolina]
MWTVVVGVHARGPAPETASYCFAFFLFFSSLSSSFPQATNAQTARTLCLHDSRRIDGYWHMRDHQRFRLNHVSSSPSAWAGSCERRSAL